jgi:hypothetical protein
MCGKIENVKIAKNRKNRNTSSGGTKRRAPPKAWLLLVLRCFSIFRDFTIFVFSANFCGFRGFPPPAGGRP